MDYPLRGIRIVEYRAGVAVAAAGMLLRDAGAEVIKLEPAKGDDSRHAAGHYVWNRGKKSLAYTSDNAPELVEIVRSSDIVLVGGQSRDVPWDLSDTQIVCFSTPYGDLKIDHNLRESDLLASSLSGVVAATASHDGTFAFPKIPFLSYAAGAMLACSAIAGLYARARTGVGQRIECPWPAVGAYMAGYQASTSSRIEVPKSRRMSPLGLSATWRIYRVQDGWVGIACPNPQFFSRLCVAIERIDLLTDPRFEGVTYLTPQGQTDLADLLTEIFASRYSSEWVERFAEAGVPGAKVLERNQFVDTDLVWDNELLWFVDDPEVGIVRQMGIPFVIEGADVPGVAPAPTLGAHDIGLEKSKAQRSEIRSGNPREAAVEHPLSGIRVADFSGFLAGPTAGRLLTELGAEVIKVEPPDGEGFRAGGMACLGVNAGKDGLALDLRHEAGADIRDRLIAESDVILHAMMPGGDEKVGLQYQSVEALNSDAVYCWISGFGRAASWRARPSFDLVLQALSGQMTALGSIDNPVYSSLPMADLCAAMLSVFGIVTSLYVRENGHPGRRVLVNQVAASMFAQLGEFVDYAGKPGGLSATPLRRLYRIADGWAAIDVACPEEWRLLTDRHAEELRPWSDWQEANAQLMGGPLQAKLEELFGRLDRRAIREQFTAAGIPCVPVVAIREDGLSNPLFNELGVLGEFDHQLFGHVTTVDRHFKFSRTAAKPLAKVQWIGENNTEVLKRLGYNDAEIDSFAADKSIVSPEPNFAWSQYT